ALGWSAARAVDGTGDLAGPVRVAPDGRAMSNALLSVEVADDGTLRLETQDGVTVAGVGRIVDGGDFGDSYNHAPPSTDALVDAPASISVEADLRGPIRGRLAVTRRYAWPAGAVADGSARTTDTVATEVVMQVELRADEPFVRIGLAFDNRSDDHRVRFHASLPRAAERSHAEGQFAVVERGMAPEGGYREEPLATYPAHGWVDAGGLAVLLDHLAEYELTDEGRELAITVLRSTGLISRNDNPYRQDPAGPEIGIPNAQMRGPWRLAFALLPHARGWIEGGVTGAAERYRHPFLTSQGGAGGEATWPPPRAGDDALRVGGDQVSLSSLRRRDEGWLEARIVNLAPEVRRAVVAGEIDAARDASLRGEPGPSLPLEPDGSLVLRLGAAEIRTVQLRRRETALGRADVLDAAGPRRGV
nr:alpha-mannosidase [Chloroflexota bacterium]